MDATTTGAPPKRPRIAALDIARGLALVAMAIYHFTWDLEFFGYVDQGLTAIGGWKLFARCIASSFLFLVGVSLFLAHGDGIRRAGFLRRFAMVAGAALAISVVTFIAVPDGFIFFGILHEIALASLLGLVFLRAPAPLTLLAAACTVAAPMFLRSTLFDHPALWWVGLSSVNPRSNDYVPLFPWFGAVLAGIAAARIARASGIAARLAPLHFGRWSRPLVFAGRHSLAFYLLHQPLLIGCVWIAAQMFPAPQVAPAVRFRNACERTCEQTRDSAFCARYCLCMLDTLESDGKIDTLVAGDPGQALRDEVEEAAGFCSMQTDDQMLGDGP